MGAQVGPLFDWYGNGDVPVTFDGDDEHVLNLVPAVFGAGRPFFGTGGVAEPVLFEDPEVVQGRRVTHLAYDVRR